MQKFTLMMVMVLLAIAATVNGATVWNPAANGIFPPATGEWNIGTNWTNEVPGVNDNKAVFNVPDAAEAIVSDAQTFGDLVQADGGPGGVIRVVDGGNLTTTGGWMSIGYSSTAKLIVEEGGQCNFNGHMWLGMHDGGEGIVEINGGSVWGGGSFGLGEYFGDQHGQCKVYVNAGELNLHHWTGAIDSDHPVFWYDSLIDIKFGTMIIRNNSVDAAQGYVDAGKITGFGIVGNVDVELVGGQTVMTANDPMEAYPSMGDSVPAGGVTFSWVNPAVDTEVEVWFGTDPNKTSGNYEVIDSGVGLTSIIWEIPESGKYYWQIDQVNEEDPNGTVISFTTTNDTPPSVEMITKSMLTWAGQGVQLDAKVTDDGTSPVTIVWSVDEAIDPNVSFSTDGIAIDDGINIEDPIVTGDSHLSQITITVTVTDEMNPEPVNPNQTATIVIDVAADACQGARGGFQRLDLVYTGDLNNDCIFDVADIAIMAADWLVEFALEGPIEITQ